ncbi:hypothetical protein F2Q69_00023291 [Brassica cretica]|uniref:Uncharacterized protein n=1 Tax=Brassica cretica TaxID=69181 RepID=A0A8S9QKS5_BRACR|nr:hypothetical protein F2Q69_00023291 [Brassica cretica]
MDIQIAQTTETIKRQQGTLPGKIDKNPKDCNAVELRSGRHLSDPVPKKLTAQEKGKQKEGEPPSLEDVHDDDHELEQPTTAVPVAPTSAIRPRSQEVQFVTRPVYPLTRAVRFRPKAFQPKTAANQIQVGGLPCVAPHGSGRMHGNNSCSTYPSAWLGLMQGATTPPRCQAHD